MRDEHTHRAAAGRRRGRRPRGPSEGGGEPPDTADLAGWLAGRLPEDWFDEPVELTVDREEITIVGRISAPLSGSDSSGGDTSSSDSRSAESGRIRRFREDTRDARIEIAQELEQRYDRKVSWGAVCGETRELFTTLSVPVMGRLRQGQRRTLDTLVAAGVARSRSEALAWCVELVRRNEQEWIEQLRAALVAVDRARSEGPDVET